MGLIVNHELSFTEVRFHQLASVVDVFVILESSMTSGGIVIDYLKEEVSTYLRYSFHSVLKVPISAHFSD